MEYPVSLGRQSQLCGERFPLRRGWEPLRFPGDVSATVKTAPASRDIPPGLTALSPFQGGIARLSRTDYAENSLAGMVQYCTALPVLSGP
jgi:hypothetical protein